MICSPTTSVRCGFTTGHRDLPTSLLELRVYTCFVLHELTAQRDILGSSFSRCSARYSDALGKALAMLPLYEILGLDPFDTEGLELEPESTVKAVAAAGAATAQPPPDKAHRPATLDGSPSGSASVSGRPTATQAGPGAAAPSAARGGGGSRMLPVGDDDSLDNLLSAGAAPSGGTPRPGSAAASSGASRAGAGEGSTGGGAGAGAAGAAVAGGRRPPAASAQKPALLPPAAAKPAAGAADDDDWLDELLAKK